MWFQVKCLKPHMEDHDDGQSQDDTARPAQQGGAVQTAGTPDLMIPGSNAARCDAALTVKHHAPGPNDDQ